MSGHFLDTERWDRRAHFDFFRTFDIPTFNITADVPVTALREACRRAGHSFALACWFHAMHAANEVEPFRYRLRDDRVWVHDRVRVATTILDADETFRFVHLPWADDLATFEREATALRSAPRPDTMDDRPEDDATIHGSTVPWISFTSVSHARKVAGASPADSIPKIVIGRYRSLGGELQMPVSVEVHHALMDGLHVGRYFTRLAERFASPATIA